MRTPTSYLVVTSDTMDPSALCPPMSTLFTQLKQSQFRSCESPLKRVSSADQGQAALKLNIPDSLLR